MNTRRILTTGALVATGALVLAGCAAGDDSASSGDKEFAGETIVVTSFGASSGSDELDLPPLTATSPENVPDEYLVYPERNATSG